MALKTDNKIKTEEATKREERKEDGVEFLQPSHVENKIILQVDNLGAITRTFLKEKNKVKRKTNKTGI